MKKKKNIKNISETVEKKNSSVVIPVAKPE